MNADRCQRCGRRVAIKFKTKDGEDRTAYIDENDIRINFVEGPQYRRDFHLCDDCLNQLAILIDAHLRYETISITDRGALNIVSETTQETPNEET